MAAKDNTSTKTNKDATFTWQGTDKKGQKVTGELTAASINIVRAELRRQGINPTKVAKKSNGLFGERKKKITSKDIAVFARQMATMLQAGVPLVQSFDIVGKGHNNPSMQELLLKVKTDIEGGITLADALAKHPLYFDDLFCNLVRAGEQAGVLEGLLDKIATYKEKTESLKGKIKKALFYPITVIMVAILVTGIIMVFVVPQFKDLFSSFGADLPAFTQFVLNISDFVAAWWWAIMGVFVAAIISLGNAYKRSRKVRETMDRLILKLPIIGPILHKASLARFCRTTATMFAAGVPLVEALQSVAGATGNTVYEEAVLQMRDEVATGQALQTTMRQQKVFTHMVIQMVAIGEESGSLDDMLSKVADFYEEEVDNAVDALSSLLEPLIMVILGTVVGGLVVALYLPIFQMSAVISGK